MSITTLANFKKTYEFIDGDKVYPNDIFAPILKLKEEQSQLKYGSNLSIDSSRFIKIDKHAVNAQLAFESVDALLSVFGRGSDSQLDSLNVNNLHANNSLFANNPTFSGTVDFSRASTILGLDNYIRSVLSVTETEPDTNPENLPESEFILNSKTLYSGNINLQSSGEYVTTIQALSESWQGIVGKTRGNIPPDGTLSDPLAAGVAGYGGQGAVNTDYAGEPMVGTGVYGSGAGANYAGIYATTSDTNAYGIYSNRFNYFKSTHEDDMGRTGATTFEFIDDEINPINKYAIHVIGSTALQGHTFSSAAIDEKALGHFENTSNIPYSHGIYGSVEEVNGDVTSAGVVGNGPKWGFWTEQGARIGTELVTGSYLGLNDPGNTESVNSLFGHTYLHSNIGGDSSETGDSSVLEVKGSGSANQAILAISNGLGNALKTNGNVHIVGKTTIEGIADQTALLNVTNHSTALWDGDLSKGFNHGIEGRGSDHVDLTGDENHGVVGIAGNGANSFGLYTPNDLGVHGRGNMGHLKVDSATVPTDTYATAYIRNQNTNIDVQTHGNALKVEGRASFTTHGTTMEHGTPYDVNNFPYPVLHVKYTHQDYNTNNAFLVDGNSHLVGDVQINGDFTTIGVVSMTGQNAQKALLTVENSSSAVFIDDGNGYNHGIEGRGSLLSVDQNHGVVGVKGVGDNSYGFWTADGMFSAGSSVLNNVSINGTLTGDGSNLTGVLTAGSDTFSFYKITEAADEKSVLTVENTGTLNYSYGILGRSNSTGTDAHGVVGEAGTGTNSFGLYTPDNAQVVGNMDAGTYTGSGSSLAVTTTNFNNNLSAADTTIQSALDTLDNLSISGIPYTTSLNILYDVTADAGADAVIGAKNTSSLNYSYGLIGEVSGTGTDGHGVVGISGSGTNSFGLYTPNNAQVVGNLDAGSITSSGITVSGTAVALSTGYGGFTATAGNYISSISCTNGVVSSISQTALPAGGSFIPYTDDLVNLYTVQASHGGGIVQAINTNTADFSHGLVGDTNSSLANSSGVVGTNIATSGLGLYAFQSGLKVDFNATIGGTLTTGNLTCNGTISGISAGDVGALANNLGGLTSTSNTASTYISSITMNQGVVTAISRTALPSSSVSLSTANTWTATQTVQGTGTITLQSDGTIGTTGGVYAGSFHRNGTNLDSIYAASGHTHSTYSLTTHTHTGVYAAFSHSHAYVPSTGYFDRGISSELRTSYFNSGDNGGGGAGGVYGLSTGNYNAYIGGLTYPFTGAHYLFLKEEVSEGDIILATDAIGIKVEQSYPYGEISNSINDKMVFGVSSKQELGSLLEHFLFVDEFSYEDSEGVRHIKAEFQELYDTLFINGWQVGSVNAVGEGMINVCEEGGNLESGDYISSSSTPGKGMKQNDDLLHNYTVAKALSSTIWIDEVDGINGCYLINGVKCKMVPCTYHCG